MVVVMPTNARESDRDEMQQIWQWLEEVADPEIPVVSVVDLGIVRAVQWANAESDGTRELVVTVTPTYSGCPAVKTIEQDIVAALKRHGIERVRMTTQLSPAWSTDWISSKARECLREYGIAPPGRNVGDDVRVIDISALRASCTTAIPCPRCKSNDTHLLSEFGSTACKALYRCNVCREPFDYFKPH